MRAMMLLLVERSARTYVHLIRIEIVTRPADAPFCGGSEKEYYPGRCRRVRCIQFLRRIHMTKGESNET